MTKQINLHFLSCQRVLVKRGTALKHKESYWPEPNSIATFWSLGRDLGYSNVAAVRSLYKKGTAESRHFDVHLFATKALPYRINSLLGKGAVWLCGLIRPLVSSAEIKTHGLEEAIAQKADMIKARDTIKTVEIDIKNVMSTLIPDKILRTEVSCRVDGRELIDKDLFTRRIKNLPWRPMGELVEQLGAQNAEEMISILSQIEPGQRVRFGNPLSRRLAYRKGCKLVRNNQADRANFVVNTTHVPEPVKEIEQNKFWAGFVGRDTGYMSMPAPTPAPAPVSEPVPEAHVAAEPASPPLPSPSSDAKPRMQAAKPLITRRRVAVAAVGLGAALLTIAYVVNSANSEPKAKRPEGVAGKTPEPMSLAA